MSVNLHLKISYRMFISYYNLTFIEQNKFDVIYDLLVYL